MQREVLRPGVHKLGEIFPFFRFAHQRLVGLDGFVEVFFDTVQDLFQATHLGSIGGKQVNQFIATIEGG